MHSVQVQGGAWLLTPLSCEPTLARVTSPVSTQRQPTHRGHRYRLALHSLFHAWWTDVNTVDFGYFQYKVQIVLVKSRLTQSWQSENCTANICSSLSVHVFCCYLWRPAKIKDAAVAVDSNHLPLLTSHRRKTAIKVTNEWANLCTDLSSAVSITSIWHHVDRWMKRWYSKWLLSIQNNTPYQLDNWMVGGDWWWLVVCTLHKICKHDP